MSLKHLPSYLKIPPHKAIADLKSRLPAWAIDQTAQDIRELYSRENVFASVKASSQEILENLQKAIIDGIATGELEIDMSAELVKIASTEKMEDWKESYATVVWRTNINTAFNTGKYRTATNPNMSNVTLGFIFRSIVDDNTRPNHLDCNRMRAKIDNPVWDFLYPPLGYNCRCSVQIIDKYMAKRNGWLDENGQLIEIIPSPVPQPDYPEFGVRPH